MKVGFIGLGAHSAGNSWMFENRMAHVLAGEITRRFLPSTSS